MSRFTDYTDLAMAGGGDHVWRHRLVDPDGSIIASTDPADGGIEWGASAAPLRYDLKAISQRTTTLTLPATDLSLVPGAEGALHPQSGNRVEIASGIILDGETIFYDQATMLPQRVTGTDSGATSLSVALVDTTEPIRTSHVEGFQYAAGENVSAVLERLIGQVITTPFVVAPSSHTTPLGSIEAGTPRERVILSLLDSIGHELISSPQGVPTTRPIPSSEDEAGVEFWRYGQSDGIVVDRSERVWAKRTPQGVRVEGGAFTDPNPPITLTVFDTDPRSAGYYDGSQQASIRVLRSDFTTSVLQAADAGHGQLRRHSEGPMIVQFKTAPNPALRDGDLMELELPNLNAEGRFRVIGFEQPQQVDGQMLVVARKVFDPAINFRPPDPDPQGCVPSVSADFNSIVDFPGHNLEAVPPGEGSPFWQEVGYSWGIEIFNGERVAEQRYGGTDGVGRGWSIAQRIAPVCDSDQSASFILRDLPSGTVTGPVIRSQLSQINGLAFLVRWDGRISIERWLNGASTETLASGSVSSIPIGSRLEISAVGSAVTASIGGTEVLSGTDTTAAGNVVGMLGLGGHHPNGPKAALFVAAAA